MIKTPETSLTQHVLPEEGLPGMYEGRKTELTFTERRGKQIKQSKFVDSGEICQVQSAALFMLSNVPSFTREALDLLPNEYVEDILAHDFDPEQYAYHVLTQLVLGKVPSPASQKNERKLMW